MPLISIAVVGKQLMLDFLRMLFLCTEFIILTLFAEL